VVDLLADRSAATAADWFKGILRSRLSAAIALASMRMPRVRVHRRRGRSLIADRFHCEELPGNHRAAARALRARIRESLPARMIRTRRSKRPSKG